ncbi:hypothetical protein ACN28S_42835 [Cystobacter fuscus]
MGSAQRWWYALKPASWPKVFVPALFGQAMGAASAGRWSAGALAWGCCGRRWTSPSSCCSTTGETVRWTRSSAACSRAAVRRRQSPTASSPRGRCCWRGWARGRGPCCWRALPERCSRGRGCCRSRP